jgi:NTE family protein
VALGGFLNLSGFARNQIVGESLALRQRARREDRRQIAARPARRHARRRGIWRLARSMAATPRPNLDGWQNSVTAYVGGETPLGMVYLGYGYSSNGPGNYYLFIGTP